MWIYFTLKRDNGLNCSVKMIPMGKYNEVLNILMDNCYTLHINYNRFIFKYLVQIYSCLNKVILLSKEWERKQTKC